MSSRNLTHGDIDIWLRAFLTVYKATGRIPQYMIDDWNNKTKFVPQEQLASFHARLSVAYSYLIPYFNKR